MRGRNSASAHKDRACYRAFVDGNVFGMDAEVSYMDGFMRFREQRSGNRHSTPRTESALNNRALNNYVEDLNPGRVTIEQHLQKHGRLG